MLLSKSSRTFSVRYDHHTIEIILNKVLQRIKVILWTFDKKGTEKEKKRVIYIYRVITKWRNNFN